MKPDDPGERPHVGRRRAATAAFLLAIALGLSCRSSVKPDQPRNPITLSVDAVPAVLTADSSSVSTIWATVLESGHPIADSTLVVFAASLGQITSEARTQDGLARATFTSAGVAGIAAVVAQVRAVRDTVLITLY